MLSDEKRQQLRALAVAATPGPWVVGIGMTAGVMAERFGPGKCAFCASGGDPVVIGDMDINGSTMLAHTHVFEDSGQDSGHSIVSTVGVTVAGNYDYEEGGIIDPADSAYIAAASPSEVLALLDELERLETALERIKANAEAWHGPPGDPGFARALAVIAAWAADAINGAQAEPALPPVALDGEQRA